MEAIRHDDVAAFVAAAEPLLLGDEARHQVMLGICSTLVRVPGFYPSVELWTVAADGRTVAALTQTPPYNALVARPAADGALETLVHGLDEAGVDLPGITAALPEAEVFAAVWQRSHGGAPRRRLAQGVYQATSIAPPAHVPGSLRLAGHDDRGLLIRWWDDFTEEALRPGSPRHPSAESVDRRLDHDGGIALWTVDGEVVSLAGFGSETPNGVRIGPVYTPPEHRRRGYGSAVTAHASRRLLEAGRRFCFLYTDLANPTSNGIYRAIGYELVCESAELEFGPRPRV